MRHRAMQIVALATLLAGAAITGGGAAHSVDGLCNGQEASHAWLNASGQRGPALIDGTGKNDVIIGSDGDDTINGKGGDDVLVGSDDDEIDRLDGGSGLDDCVVSTGDDARNCEY
jgi:Ca2+-binding RTX toxin-like protein